MSSHLVFQLYCTPVEADAVRSALVSEVATFAEFGDARIEFAQEAEADYEMHLSWAAQHPGEDPADRGYFLLQVQSATDIPESVLREVESALWEWIDSTYHGDSDEVVEVHVASHAGTKFVD
ncbi:hypothetical protein AB0M22_13500 [Nocardia sp. NPDC051756]|uniref:hypothetical protein n=1 Tax=Nocardia sp. NPDC051756 TaxID=3154751 RepID=UPI00344AC98C